MNNMNNNRTGKSLFAPTITAFLAFAISFTIFACSSGGDSNDSSGGGGGEEKTGEGNGACKATYVGTNGSVVTCAYAPNITVNQQLCEKTDEGEDTESVEFVSKCPPNPDLECTDGKIYIDIYLSVLIEYKDMMTCKAILKNEDMESR